MDANLRWFRRVVVASAIERVAAEAIVAGLVAGGVAVGVRWRPAEVALATIGAALTFAALRVGLALATNPINHRYLLRWTDPTSRLRVGRGAGPDGGQDRLAGELLASGFRFLARLQRVETPVGDGSGDVSVDGLTANGLTVDGLPAIDLYRAERGRVVVASGDDDEITVISRLDDGRRLVTASSLIPPTERLLVARIAARSGHHSPTDAVIEHVDRLLALRSRGIEAEGTEVDDVVAVLRAEWEAWQELGPFVGPLVAVGPRRRARLSLQIDVPDQLIDDRTAPTAADLDGGPPGGRPREKGQRRT